MRILIIEDEEAVATAVQRDLASAGFAVEVEADGSLGLDRALTGQFDLIVLDLMLPTMNGFQICHAIRDAGVWTPIMMLTAKAGENDEAEGLETGADDYLRKPFSMVVLRARINALLRRPRRNGDEPFACGDLRIDPASHLCQRGNSDIELTAREMEVLAFLMRRVRQVVPKLDLVENVWGENFDGNPNIAEVYVGHLRRKIDVPFGRSTIQTVRGVGYRLVDDKAIDKADDESNKNDESNQEADQESVDVPSERPPNVRGNRERAKTSPNRRREMAQPTSTASTVPDGIDT